MKDYAYKEGYINAMKVAQIRSLSADPRILKAAKGKPLWIGFLPRVAGIDTEDLVVSSNKEDETLARCKYMTLLREFLMAVSS